MADIKQHEPVEGRIHKAVAVQADPEHVHAEPGKGRDNVAEEREIHQATLAHNSPPPGVQDERIPDDDQQRAIFLWIPAPETAPVDGVNSTHVTERLLTGQFSIRAEVIR